MADATLVERLVIAEGAQVLHIGRLRRTDDAQLAVLDNNLPQYFIDLSRDDLTQYGLYQLLRLQGTTMYVARERMGARESCSTSTLAILF